MKKKGSGLTLMEVVVVVAIITVAGLAFANRIGCGTDEKSVGQYLDDKAACTWWEEHSICVCAHKGAWAFQASDEACMRGEWDVNQGSP